MREVLDLPPDSPRQQNSSVVRQSFGRGRTIRAAHGDFVRGIIDKAHVVARASRFPNIAATYSASVLQRNADQPPYYCHYMAWRLARLPDSYLARFDHLLGIAAAIDGCKTEVRSLVGDADFSVFWSLNWQLQVAEYLVRRGYTLRWLSDGPDLLASKDGQLRYVECFTPRKHFGRSLFLEELLRALHPNLRVDSLMFLKRTMPDGHALDAFLDSLFQQLLQPGFVEELENQASINYPVPVPLPEGADNLNVYMDGQNTSAYDPHVLPKGAGDVDAYWSLILNEVVSNKSNANSLATSRPNAVLVNFLLGYDQQAATWMGDPPATDLGPNLDELVWGTIGITSAISSDELSSMRGWLP